MNDDLTHDQGSKTDNDLRSILMSSLLGTTGLMWVVGGFLAILNLFDVFWLLGWLGAFVWVWGCWAAVLYFDLKRFVS